MVCKYYMAMIILLILLDLLNLQIHMRYKIMTLSQYMNMKVQTVVLYQLRQRQLACGQNTNLKNI